MNESNRICPWCSTPVPTGAAACPRCGAVIEGSLEQDIPGLTVVEPKVARRMAAPMAPNVIDPGARLQVGKGGDVIDPEAVRLPSEAVRREMRKIELEAEIENAGSVVMNPTGDESRDARTPSNEAIAAYEAGLLDRTGPAGETDLDDLARAWQDPESK